MPNNNPLTAQSFEKAAKELGVDVATILAVKDVESAGSGFLGSGKPKILFEGHIFSKLTRGKFDQSNPTISYPKWTTQHYIGGEGEWKRFNTAFELDPIAAMESASWGLFQILGTNFKQAGFATVGDYVTAMRTGEENQLDAFVQYVKNTGLADELQRKDWASFAKKYNGPLYLKNQYDRRLADAYRKHSR